jgi:hypothetical protein
VCCRPGANRPDDGAARLNASGFCAKRRALGTLSGASPHCTSTGKFTVDEAAPLTPVTVTEKLPVGVPGFPPLLPRRWMPPRFRRRTKRKEASEPPQLSQWRPLPRIGGSPAKSTITAPVHKSPGGSPGSWMREVWGAVVVTVNVVDPLPVTLPGLKLHVLSAGRPEHVKLTAPLKPFCAATVIVVLPDPPGLETVTSAGFAERVNSGVIEN